MTVYEDFEPFFRAMIKEMRRHDPKFGDSWRRTWISLTGNDLMNQELDRKLGQCFLKYWKNPDGNQDELIDIANLCAMRWLRDSSEGETE